MADDRCLKWEVGPVVVPKEWDFAAARMRNGETRDLRTEVRGQRSEDGGQRAEDRNWNAETKNQEPATRNQGPGTSAQGPVTSDQEPAARDQQPETSGSPKPRIGIFKDSAFQFYYPENIDALVAGGAEVIFISPLKDKALPELDGLYIGGGFPETHARQLADNRGFNSRLKALVEDGFPIYAECGGLMYLGENLVLEGKSYPMAGILPLTFDFYQRPQGHGYTIFKVERENPYYPIGSEIRGHEFHYSRVSNWTGDKNDLVFQMKRGVGIDKDRDGIIYKNVLATYTHVHAIGTPEWGEALVRRANFFKTRRGGH